VSNSALTARTALTKQAWEMLEAEYLFSGKHPDGNNYHAQAHIKEMIPASGLPPVNWLFEDSRGKIHFDPEGARRY
jgi:hypothetical protein